MSIIEDMRAVLDSGVKGSRRAIDTARERLKRIGDEGVTSLDIRQLRGEQERLLLELGRAVHETFASGERKSVTPKSPGIKELLAELETLEATLAEKEAALSALKNDRSPGGGDESPRE